MQFRRDYSYSSGRFVSTEDNGKVRFSDWVSDGGMSVYPEMEGGKYYSSCISILDDVAELHPEVYRAVYDHIQGRNEPQYLSLKAYCKKKNNELARKFTIIK